MLAAVAAIFCAVWFSAWWAFARARNNAGWVDVAWASAFTPVAALSAWLGTAPWPRRLAFTAAVAAWSLRLSWHVGRRVARERKEDPRYAPLRAAFGAKPWPAFFLFFQAQALLVIILALPVFSAALDRSAFPHGWELAGWIFLFTGLAGETLADGQLAQFRSRSENRGKICEVGLWGWSRHPNYFFEWVAWLGLAMIGMGGPAGAWCWLSPGLMLLLLTKVTGIPPAEARMAQTRGAAFLDYKRRVSAFLPLPPKR